MTQKDKTFSIQNEVILEYIKHLMDNGCRTH